MNIFCSRTVGFSLLLFPCFYFGHFCVGHGQKFGQKIAAYHKRRFLADFSPKSAMGQKSTKSRRFLVSSDFWSISDKNNEKIPSFLRHFDQKEKSKMAKVGPGGLVGASFERKLVKREENN